jgi:hypothetical protein
VRVATECRWRKDIWAGGGSERCGPDRAATDTDGMGGPRPQSAAESIHKLVGIRRGIAKVGHRWGNFGLCCCGWQAVGSAPGEKGLYGVSEQTTRVYYGAVSESNQEIPVKTTSALRLCEWLKRYERLAKNEQV